MVSGIYSVTSEGVLFFDEKKNLSLADPNLNDNVLPLIPMLLLAVIFSDRKYLYQILQIVLYYQLSCTKEWFCFSCTSEINL